MPLNIEVAIGFDLLHRRGNNLLEVLHRRGDPVVVPQVVLQEVRRRGPSDPAVQALQRLNWLVPVDPGPAPAALAAWNLGAGEMGVLTYGLTNPGTEVVLDDWTARLCAGALGIPRCGTVALVLLAKQFGLIPAARPVLEQLRKNGMYLSDRVMNHALAAAGE